MLHSFLSLSLLYLPELFKLSLEINLFIDGLLEGGSAAFILGLSSWSAGHDGRDNDNWWILYYKVRIYSISLTNMELFSTSQYRRRKQSTGKKGSSLSLIWRVLTLQKDDLELKWWWCTRCALWKEADRATLAALLVAGEAAMLAKPLKLKGVLFLKAALLWLTGENVFMLSISVMLG